MSDSGPDGGETPAVTPKVRRPSLLTRRVLGPFILAEVLSVVIAMLFVGGLLLLLTRPLGARPEASAVQPGSSFYVVGAAQQGLQVGAPAPELTGAADGNQIGLTDLNGNPVRLSGYRGRPVWINFWATWCPPCQGETPILRDVYNEHAGEGLVLIGISVQETSVDDVRAYVQRYGLNYIVAFDATSAIFHEYRAFGLPTQVFIDRDGIVRDVILGPVTRDRAEQEVKDLLGAGATR